MTSIWKTLCESEQHWVANEPIKPQRTSRTGAPSCDHRHEVVDIDVVIPARRGHICKTADRLRIGTVPPEHDHQNQIIDVDSVVAVDVGQTSDGELGAPAFH